MADSIRGSQRHVGTAGFGRHAVSANGWCPRQESRSHGYVYDVVFAGPTVEMEDDRKDDGEKRIICFGFVASRVVVVGYTPRGADRHVFSMRKANDRETARIAPLLKV